LVLFLKDLLDGLAGFLLLGGILKEISGDDILQVSIKTVASGHDVAQVDKLDEGLDAGAALDTLGAHALGDLERVALDTADEGRGELLTGGLVGFVKG
jgi:hypothetical protein